MSRVKGVGPKTALKWFRKYYGEEGVERILEGCASSIRQTCKNLLAAQWYPTEIASALCLSFAKSGLGGQGAVLDDLFRRLGYFIAEENLSTLYKVILKFTTVNSMLVLLTRSWKMYFDDITVEVEPESEGPGTGTCRVKGLGDCHYISLIGAGWIEFGYRKVGAKYIEVKELNYRKDFTNPDELIYKIRWR